MPHNPASVERAPGPWQASVITLFPEMFPGPLAVSLVGQALEAGLWSLQAVGLRDFGEGRQRQVDDTPAGGGAGMVLRADVVAAAVDKTRAASQEAARLPAIYLSPRGEPLTQRLVKDLAAGPGVLLLAGRFEGVDERVLEARDFREVSIGDYVLSGGELAAMVLMDACVRLIPGVIGAPDSLTHESFENGLLEYPQYTRPREWEGRVIPDVLLSGDHGRIAKWRQSEAEQLTRIRRPDLSTQKPHKK
ncbi:MAG: tRNA (guanosine(37)-N1)-methyltransferase TrmD [Alphaproteobacteria bacterium]|nr:tRNA (guanosine(37)-N1)-methyltransferase TrmD [Alphaproteobacteria bacterium]